MRYLSYLIANPEARILLYFLLGGTAVAIATYLAGQGRGTLAAFVSTLPIVTATTFILIYSEGGSAPVAAYARGLLVFTPPWICYVVTVLLGVERLGVFKSIALGFAVYILLSYFFRAL